MYACMSARLCALCASRLRPPASARRPAAACFSSSLADAPLSASPSSPAARPEGGERGFGFSAPSAQNGRRAFLRHRLGRPVPNASDESAVALFNDVVKEADAPGPAVEGAVARRPSLGEWETAAKMKELEKKCVGSREKLALFQAEIWPHVDDMRGQIPRHLYIATSRFLAGACDAVAAEGHVGCSVELSRMCGRIGKWDLHLRNELVLSLCDVLVSRQLASAERSLVVAELVDLWRHISQLKRKSQAYDSPLRFVLPSPSDIFRHGHVGLQRESNMAAPTKALASIFVQFRLEQARQLVPGLLTTVAVLSDPQLTSLDQQVEAAPLLRLVAAALPRGSIDEAYVNQVFGVAIRFPPSKLPGLRAYVVAHWPDATAMLHSADSPWRQGLGPSEGHRFSSLKTFNKELRAAYRSRSAGAVASIWQDLKDCLAQRPELAKQLREEPDFFDFCIFVWCAMRHPAKLQETLDLTQELEVQLTVKSYTAMMHGWKVCKDGDRIAALWDKLVKSGGKLDVVIWTARISGLFGAGRFQDGVQALGEMMAMWKRALLDKGDAEAAATVAVQPNIEVINAAFNGLVRVDLKAANEVLAWAHRQGIDPNTRTYNILLRQMFRNGTPDGARDLLRAMTKRGIDPDAATFTIILEEVLGAMDDTTAAEQVRAVRQVLADIESAGLRANVETYAKMLYAVASLANGGADEAIVEVQEHMRANGMSLTPHMMTILIERALARGRPAPGAVQALLREHGLTHIGQGDQTLWERVMSAHAATGDTQAAMAVFDDLTRAGRPVTSLPCLTEMVRALLAVGKLEDARRVVHATLAHKRSRAEVGRDGRYWRHHFWYLAVENKLLDRDEMPRELQSDSRWSDSGS